MVTASNMAPLPTVGNIAGRCVPQIDFVPWKQSRLCRIQTASQSGIHWPPSCKQISMQYAISTSSYPYKIIYTPRQFQASYCQWNVPLPLERLEHSSEQYSFYCSGNKQMYQQYTWTDSSLGCASCIFHWKFSPPPCEKYGWHTRLHWYSL